LSSPWEFEPAAGSAAVITAIGNAAAIATLAPPIKTLRRDVTMLAGELDEVGLLMVQFPCDRKST
jgi:hypothetical protein